MGGEVQRIPVNGGWGSKVTQVMGDEAQRITRLMGDEVLRITVNGGWGSNNNTKNGGWGSKDTSYKGDDVQRIKQLMGNEVQRITWLLANGGWGSKAFGDNTVNTFITALELLDFCLMNTFEEKTTPY